MPFFDRRTIAGLWFAAFAAVATFLFFLRLRMSHHAVILYIALPTLAAAIGGYIWGGAILEPSRVQNYGQATLRGLLISGATFVIFAALYACGLPLLEGQRSLQQVGGLFLLTLTLGMLTGGPLAVLTGITAAITLFRFGRQFGCRFDH